MNYLAHALLSHYDPELLLGNFIADHLRGNDFSSYPEGVIQGIKMHREIDSFTDAHPKFKASKRYFYKNFEKYSGILVDIYFDHLLASNFTSFHKQPLSEFNKKIYQTYTENLDLMPESSSRFLAYVLKNNVYSQYAELDGIKQVLSHLSYRIGHTVRLENSTLDYIEKREEFEQNFFLFMKELRVEFDF